MTEQPAQRSNPFSPGRPAPPATAFLIPEVRQRLRSFGDPAAPCRNAVIVGPAASGRTTYLWTLLDAVAARDDMWYRAYTVDGVSGVAGAAYALQSVATTDATRADGVEFDQLAPTPDEAADTLGDWASSCSDLRDLFAEVRHNDWARAVIALDGCTMGIGALDALIVSLHAAASATRLPLSVVVTGDHELLGDIPGLGVRERFLITPLTPDWLAVVLRDTAARANIRLAKPISRFLLATAEPLGIAGIQRVGSAIADLAIARDVSVIDGEIFRDVGPALAAALQADPRWSQRPTAGSDAMPPRSAGRRVLEHALARLYYGRQARVRRVLRADHDDAGKLFHALLDDGREWWAPGSLTRPSTAVDQVLGEDPFCPVTVQVDLTPAVPLRVGQQALHDGDLDEADRCFAEMASVRGAAPRDIATGLAHLGLVRVRQGQRAEAIRLWTLAAVIEPTLSQQVSRWAGMPIDPWNEAGRQLG